MHRGKANTCFWELQGERLPGKSQPGPAAGLEEDSSPRHPVFLLQDQATPKGQKGIPPLHYLPAQIQDYCMSL